MSEFLRLRFAFSITAFLLGAYACGSDNGLDPKLGLGPAAGTGGTGSSSGGSGATSGNVGGAGTGGNGGSSAAASGGTGGGVQVDVDMDASAAGSPSDELTEDAACGTGEAGASLLPISLLVMFDRSGSMVNDNSIDPVTGMNRWETATSALGDFFKDPKAAGLGVALRFFPHDLPAAGCTASACDVDACSKVLVDMGTLTEDSAPTDTQEAALLDAITTSTPGGNTRGEGTPMYAALDGALTWATAYQAAHPEQKTVVVLVTDGSPNGCDEDFDHISALASDAVASSGVTTYAIGLADSNGNGVNPDNMNQLAKAGGTDQAFFINDGPTASAELLAAFDAIRGMALSCDFPMPEATDDGKPVDPSLVNVTFTSGGGDETTFTKVEDADHCGDAASWYYDDDKAPTRIYLCPSACDVASTDPMAKLTVLVGCKPKLEVPR